METEKNVIKSSAEASVPVPVPVCVYKPSKEVKWEQRGGFEKKWGGENLNWFMSAKGERIVMPEALIANDIKDGFVNVAAGFVTKAEQQDSEAPAAEHTQSGRKNISAALAQPLRAGDVTDWHLGRPAQRVRRPL